MCSLHMLSGQVLLSVTKVQIQNYCANINCIDVSSRDQIYLSKSTRWTLFRNLTPFFRTCYLSCYCSGIYQQIYCHYYTDSSVFLYQNALFSYWLNFYMLPEDLSHFCGIWVQLLYAILSQEFISFSRSQSLTCMFIWRDTKTPHRKKVNLSSWEKLHSKETLKFN